MSGRTKQDARATPSRPRGRPRSDGAADVPSASDRLLDAAIDLFARHGYDPVTTGAVAEAAGLTQSMVHYHFGSKAKLWEAAIDRLMRERGELFRPDKLDLRHLEPMERLRELVRRLVEANAVQPNHARIAMHEGMAGSPRLDWLVDRYMKAGYGVFDRAVADAIAAGAIAPMAVPDVTNVLTSAASLSFVLGPVIERVYGFDPAGRQRIEAFTEVLLGILFDGLRPRADSPIDSGPGPMRHSVDQREPG